MTLWDESSTLEDSPSGPTPTDEETLFVALQDMLGDSGFLFPLVAAERQYRDRYYGLSSAALLEDLFHDAFANFISRRRPTVRFERPGRGQRGWDYRFESLEVSHKVGKQPQAIAALWDATVEATTWTFEYPIVYLCSGYSPGTGALATGLGQMPGRILSGVPGEAVPRRHRLWLVEWPPGETARVLWTAVAAERATVGELLVWDDVWPVVARAIDRGVPANHLEIVRSTNADLTSRIWGGDEELEVRFDLRSGIYLFPTASLQDVPVESNNRAVLLPKHTVSDLMVAAQQSGFFVPLPLWFRCFAGGRPPDLYLAQRAEFDELFSPAGPRSQAGAE